MRQVHVEVPVQLVVMVIVDPLIVSLSVPLAAAQLVSPVHERGKVSVTTKSSRQLVAVYVESALKVNVPVSETPKALMAAPGQKASTWSIQCSDIRAGTDEGPRADDVAAAWRHLEAIGRRALTTATRARRCRQDHRRRCHLPDRAGSCVHVVASPHCFCATMSTVTTASPIGPVRKVHVPTTSPPQGGT